jgi:hypothetical protein
MTPSGNSEVSPEEAARRFPGRTFRDVTKFEAQLSTGEKVWIRQGTFKSRGWQITLKRGDAVGADIREGKDGFLLVNRGRCWLIPLSQLHEWIGESLSRSKRAVDIFLDTDRETLYAPNVDRLSISQFGAP